MFEGLKNPLAIVRAAHLLEQQIDAMELHVEISSDFVEFAEIRLEMREDIISPMFDPAINSFTEQNAFWMIARNDDGDAVAFQAFRLDTVDGSLADWAMRWMAGLYLLRSELVVPAQLVAPPNSITHSVSGYIVYQGELWVNRQLRNRKCSAVFPRLGMMLCLLKWQPVAMWGVMGKSMASRGHPTRAGYPHTENGFLRWSVPPKGAEKNEYIILAKKSDLEFIAGQTVSKSV